MRPKYFISDRVFGANTERTLLFPDLFAAIRGCFWSKSAITPVPTAWGGVPLKPFAGGFPWRVQSHSVHEDGEVYDFVKAAFDDPVDAFLFAKAKEEADNYGKRPTKWFVLLCWNDESGRVRELEKLPAAWLAQQRRDHERSEKRKQRATRENALAHAES